MKKIFAITLLILFIIYKDNVLLASINAYSIWSKNLFPIIFPTLMITDFLLGSKVINIIIKPFKYLTNKLFKTNNYYIYILFISLIAGTPTNVKSIKSNNLTNDEINKILSSVILFNPLFVIKYASLKIYIILVIANTLSLLVNRNHYDKYTNNYQDNYEYNFNESIKSNLEIIFNILGIFTVFMVLSSLIPLNNVYLKVLISGLLEVTNGLIKANALINNLFIKETFYLLFLSFGGLSILFQIKSILKDTSIDYKYYFKNRMLVFIMARIMNSLF